MEDNFRRVPPPPRPFIPRPPEQPQTSEVQTQNRVVEPKVEEVSKVEDKTQPVKVKKERKPLNPKLKLALLVMGAVVSFGGAIACICLLLI